VALADAFAAAAGVPKASVRVGAVTDVVASSSGAGRRRLRQAPAGSGGVTVEYIVESTDVSIISSATAGIRGGGGGGGGGNSNTSTSDTTGFAALLATQLTLGGVSATVAAVAAPVVKAEVGRFFRTSA